MTRFTSIARIAILASSLLALAACDTFKSKPDEPEKGSLVRRLVMIGEDGKRYGTVELDPVNGGQMYDANGNLIGFVVKPQ